MDIKKLKALAKKGRPYWVKVSLMKADMTSDTSLKKYLKC